MKKNPLFVAVSNQKGGVGKSTMLITLASLLNYSMGKNVAIVDCDSTQRSLFNLRERDMEMVEINKKYMVLPPLILFLLFPTNLSTFYLRFPDRKSTRLNSSHGDESRMPSSA